MAPEDVKAAGIVIVAGGYKRSPLDVARDFVREQMDGAWNGDGQEEDARHLAEVLAAYGDPSNAGGPMIPPFAFGARGCLCAPGVECFCKAFGCPRKRKIA